MNVVRWLVFLEIFNIFFFVILQTGAYLVENFKERIGKTFTSVDAGVLSVERDFTLSVKRGKSVEMFRFHKSPVEKLAMNYC